LVVRVRKKHMVKKKMKGSNKQNMGEEKKGHTGSNSREIFHASYHFGGSPRMRGLGSRKIGTW